LNHPNILAVHDVGIHKGSPYIVTELLEGEELREHLNNGRLNSRKATDYAQQIAQGLAAAHEKGIIHRDLKPENLCRVKILDFGLAKLRPQRNEVNSSEIATRKQVTNPGTVMGTVGYMSPEQVRGRPADHRSDIFSFGAILRDVDGKACVFRRVDGGDDECHPQGGPARFVSDEQNNCASLRARGASLFGKTPRKTFSNGKRFGIRARSIVHNDRLAARNGNNRKHRCRLKVAQVAAVGSDNRRLAACVARLFASLFSPRARECARRPLVNPSA